MAADEIDLAYDHLVPLAREFPCRSGFIDILHFDAQQPTLLGGEEALAQYYLGVWNKAEEAVHPAQSGPLGLRVVDAHRTYQQSGIAIPTIQTLFSTGHTNVYYKSTPINDLRTVMAATDNIIEDLTALKLS